MAHVMRAVAMAGACAAVVAGSPALAADCKPMTKAQCEAASSCLWMDSYKSKSGTLVRSHCVYKNKKKGTVLNRLFNNKTSSTTITKLSSKKKVDVNSKPASKLK
ncbi:hypothetical protein [uncultured Cohaesibacter sp.]|uniref:hypothetical protein n=1 Tax=uncultured Cohaesibacter sp. TaxID=1002546 RepID=UPI0029C93B01|nr:hypothetical protein [uncultured Cohaesibacter sp.]